MSPQEAVAVARLVKACCPQQAWDEYTGDAYHDLLGDLRFEDCRGAVVALGKRQAFIAPAEIRTQVRRIRETRLMEHPPLNPPPELDPNDTEGYSRWLRTTRKAIADGEIVSEPAALTARTMPNMDSLMPAPEYVSRSQIVAETKRAKSPDFDRNLENVRAELAGRPEIPMREPETPLTDEPTEETA